MKESDIRGRVAAMTLVASRLMAAKSEAERGAIVAENGAVLVQSGIDILTQFFVDVNRIADALESIAMTQNMMLERSIQG
jgi:hypothetical protein